MHHPSSPQPGVPEERIAPFVQKMNQAELPESLIELFVHYVRQVLSTQERPGLIPEEDIEPIRAGEIPRQGDLSDALRRRGESVLDQTVMIKLNGGLGTSMGMPYAKSLLPVKDGRTFLSIIRSQAAQQGFPLVLMDSFNTRSDVAAYWERQGVPAGERPLSFLQHKFPKILAETLQPAHWPEDPDLEWNPPGHGDLYAALESSGTLDRLLNRGKCYALVSNADNLGAVVHPFILGYMAERELPFLMEVAKRYPADKKGGHLAKDKEGGLVLREIAQCPEKDREAFQDISRYEYFNTNNVWIDLRQLKVHIQEHGLPKLPLIINPKTLDPRDESTPKVYQLETAMGSGINVFPRGGAIQVFRDRFVPVKKTNDLLAVRSDCYVLDERYKLAPHPKRKLPPVEVELDSRFYKLIDDFEERFPSGPPSLLDCEALTVEGDVLVADRVACRGRVRIVNASGQQARIAPGSELEGKVVLA
jgi:UTP--glucose-1-phosphate uridylyltransferase